MLHMVTKRFNGPNGKSLEIGDIVDAGGWKHRRILLEHRYIIPTDASQPTVTIDEGEKPKGGRKTSLLASPIKGSRKAQKSKARKRRRS